MADGVRVRTNAVEVAGWLHGRNVALRPAAVALVRHWGVRLQAQVKANASGRPGPRMITGDYNRSIALDVDAGNQPAARVGTNRPQARRLEFGFHGVDSLGRSYDQPPFPHFGPAHSTIGPLFEAAAAELLGRVIGG